MVKTLEKIVSNTKFGDVVVRIGTRTRGVSIRIDRHKQVIISMPSYCTVEQGMEFLELKSKWVTKHLEKLDKIADTNIIHLPYKTRLYTLERWDNDIPTIKIFTGRIIIGLPTNCDIDSPVAQSTIRQALVMAWQDEAKTILPLRVDKIAREHGFKYGKISIRNCRTRWGSCNANDDLSLSLHLMSLSDQLIDYVILHELCHTIEKNHGAEFHKLLDKCSHGQHQMLRTKLKTITII